MHVIKNIFKISTFTYLNSKVIKKQYNNVSTIYTFRSEAPPG